MHNSQSDQEVVKQMGVRAIVPLALSAVLVSSVSFVLQGAEAACCYFSAKDKDINQPGQKAFISWNPVAKTEAFTVQPKFEGNAVDFGMVIPTPGRPKLDEMPRDFFKNLALYTILMPLPEPIYTPLDPPIPMACAPCCEGGASNAPMSFSAKPKSTVKVLESGVVGSLDYKIIVAEQANDLYQWLKANKYSYSGDESTLQFYITKKWYFTVMKIDSKQMKKAADGSYLGEVTPTRFSFTSNECIYPLKITQISVKDKTEALFYVQSTQQMDLPGDWSWMHSYRPMYLTYMLGCSADAKQQKELETRSNWLQAMQKKDANFETTKLEWSRKLGTSDLSVLEDPLKNYGQAGAGNLPAGAKVTTLPEFLNVVKAEYLKQNKNKLSKNAESDLARMGDQYQPAKGMIVRYDDKSVGRGYIYTRFGWYPARQVPLEEVKGLALLKGHLQQGQWLTKFRKIVRKDEMTKDMVLASVPAAEQQEYIRIMPTSPP